jgi:hypothetical protein
MERMQQHLITTVTSTRNIMSLYIKQRYGKNATTPIKLVLTTVTSNRNIMRNVIFH